MMRRKSLIFVLLSILIICGHVPQSVGADDSQVDNESVYSAAAQEILCTITGLEFRNTHFYILMDVSGSTTVNNVSNRFNEFYQYLAKNFFTYGDTITYLPYARHTDLEAAYTFAFDKNINPIIPAGKSDDKGTDIYEPIEKILSLIEENNNKAEECIVIMRFSDRLTNDTYDEPYWKDPSLFYPTSISRYQSLHEMLNKEKKEILFELEPPLIQRLGEEKAYLSVWFTDNIPDFPISVNVNREINAEGLAMSAAVVLPDDIEFRIKENNQALSYNLYVSDDLSELKQALTTGQFDTTRVWLMSNIQYDNLEEQGEYNFPVRKKELLDYFPSANEHSLYYSIQAVSGSSQDEMKTLFIRELKPITLVFDNTPIFVMLAVLSFVGIVYFISKKTKHTITYNGKNFTLDQTKCVHILCSNTVPSSSDTVVVPSSNDYFFDKRIAKIVVKKEILNIPLFKLKLTASKNDPGFKIIDASKPFSTGTHKITVVCEADNSQETITLTVKDSLKKNRKNLFGFGVSSACFLIFITVLFIFKFT